MVLRQYHQLFFNCIYIFFFNCIEEADWNWISFMPMQSWAKCPGNIVYVHWTCFFIFILLYLILRFLKYRCSFCRGANDDTQRYCPKAVAVCLISPVIWVIILLIDGEYIACGMTYWNGVYVFDDDLQKLWCKPTEEIRNKTVTELRNLTSTYIHHSQVNNAWLFPNIKLS